ncbi:MAG TPA: acetyltransferase [Bacteroidia bacterium]|jgi:putative colanic acid biosynthesis acetyltransferase WcaF|nr:acetyltransferase [Bacteroidia bacterium]
MNIKLWMGSFLNYFYNNLITHIPIHFVRKSFLRIFNKNIAADAVILMHSRFLNFWEIEIAERVVINQYCLMDCRKYKIKIGHDTDIGPYTKIWTLGHNPNSDTHELYGGHVNIDHHVWIASNVTILPKLTIAAGAVVAASSVVHKDVESLAIVAGNPAITLKKRINTLTYKLKYTPIFE